MYRKTSIQKQLRVVCRVRFSRVVRLCYRVTDRQKVNGFLPLASGPIFINQTYLTWVTAACKRSKTCSVRFDVIQIMCCVASSRPSIPSDTVIPVDHARVRDKIGLLPDRCAAVDKIATNTVRRAVPLPELLVHYVMLQLLSVIV